MQEVESNGRSIDDSNSDFVISDHAKEKSINSLKRNITKWEQFLEW